MNDNNESLRQELTHTKSLRVKGAQARNDPNKKTLRSMSMAVNKEPVFGASSFDLRKEGGGEGGGGGGGGQRNRFQLQRTATAPPSSTAVTDLESFLEENTAQVGGDDSRDPSPEAEPLRAAVRSGSPQRSRSPRRTSHTAAGAWNKLPVTNQASRTMGGNGSGSSAGFKVGVLSCSLVLLFCCLCPLLPCFSCSLVLFVSCLTLVPFVVVHETIMLAHHVGSGGAAGRGPLRRRAMVPRSSAVQPVSTSPDSPLTP